MKNSPTSLKIKAVKELACRELERRNKDKQESLVAFMKYFFEREKQQVFQHNWHHDLISGKLDKVLKGEITRLMINIPPGHMKTELVTKCFPVHSMGNDPTIEIIATGYSTNLTQTYSGQARDYYRSSTFSEVFPRAPKIRDDQDTKEWWVNNQGGSYYATGTGGSITGRRCNIFIIDDPLKPDEGDSVVKRESVNKWYENTVLSRLYNPIKDAVIIIMQRVHDGDLCGYLQSKMQNDTGESWDIVSLPAIALKDDDYRKKGEALHVDRYPVEALHRLKKSAGSSNFSCQYQQDPVSDEIREFKLSWIKKYDDLPKRLKIRIIVDLASSEDKRSDENSILVIGKSLDERDYVIESWGDWETEGRRFNPEEVINKIYSLADDYSSIDPTLSINVETVSYQQTMRYWLKNYSLKRRQSGLNVYRIDEIKTPTNRSKDDKIRALIPYISNGLIVFPHFGTDILEDQMIRFPKGQRVDRLDTLAMALDIQRKPKAHHMSNIPKPRYENGRIIKF